MSVKYLPIEIIHHIGKYLDIHEAVWMFYPNIRRTVEIVRLFSADEKYCLLDYFIILNKYSQLKIYLKFEKLDLFVNDFRLLKSTVKRSKHSDFKILNLFLKNENCVKSIGYSETIVECFKHNNQTTFSYLMADKNFKLFEKSKMFEKCFKNILKVFEDDMFRKCSNMFFIFKVFINSIAQETFLKIIKIYTFSVQIMFWLNIARPIPKELKIKFCVNEKRFVVPDHFETDVKYLIELRHGYLLNSFAENTFNLNMFKISKEIQFEYLLRQFQHSNSHTGIDFSKLRKELTLKYTHIL